MTQTSLLNHKNRLKTQNKTVVTQKRETTVILFMKQTSLLKLQTQSQTQWLHNKKLVILLTIAQQRMTQPRYLKTRGKQKNVNNH